MARARAVSPLTSSAGRLFDAVAAILGVRDETRYEGQAAIELEQQADPAEHGAYRVDISAGRTIAVRTSELVRAVTNDLRAGVPIATIAARFHNGMASTIAAVCTTLRSRTGITTVALSGGVFQNLLLLERTVDLLDACGFRVLTHVRVPCNDGGISFGQAVVAA